MKTTTKLRTVKAVHTIIYLVMVFAIFQLLFAGITKTYDTWFYISLSLLVAETIIFISSGMKCPLTAVARSYGDPKGYVGDTFFPEKYTKYTFRVFGTIFFVDLFILLSNYLNIR